MRSRRGEGDLLSLLLVAALLAGAYYFWYLPQSQLTPGSVMSLTINYADGTTKTVESNTLLPNTITDGSGKVIDGISWTIKVTPVYTGTATSTSVTGGLTLEVDGIVKSTSNLPTYSSKILSGQTAQIATGSITANTLQSYNSVGGSHTLRVTASLTMNAVFDDSTTASKAGSNQGTISYAVSATGITTLSVSVSPAYYGGL